MDRLENAKRMLKMTEELKAKLLEKPEVKPEAAKVEEKPKMAPKKEAPKKEEK